MTQVKSHDHSHLHTTGKAVFIDDIPEPPGLLIGKVFYSNIAHAFIKSYSLEDAKNLKGVHAIISYEDIIGENTIGPVIQDEFVLAEIEVEFIGQAIFLIAAESYEIADKAVSLIEIEYEELPIIIDLPDAILKGELLYPERRIKSGNPTESIEKSQYQISGEFSTGAQEHWYLETQIALVIPGEDSELKVHSSSQHPSEVQSVIAEVLGLSANKIEVEVKRMGGAFGGKETQAGLIAVWASLLVQKTGRPVKIRLLRDEDQKITGKRHPFLIKYNAGFDKSGKINALDVELNANGGAANDLSKAILERAMFHVDNAYYISDISIIGKIWKTNITPNTAFRGFGAPQGMAAIENIIDRVARFLKMDAALVRKINFYNSDNHNITPYGQVVKNNRLDVLYERLMESSDYMNRRIEINQFNTENKFTKKGIAISPVKFGISFTTSFLNQAGALVNIYRDGSIIVNHGGTEMGQGLHTKIRKIAADELGVSTNKIIVTATNTSKVPNTSATAASSGTDLNGMAVKDAVDKLKYRLSEVAVEYFSKTFNVNCSSKDIRFGNNFVFEEKTPENKISFSQLVEDAYLSRKSLSATGFYKTPGINFDPEKGKGTPFYYYAFGMCVSEVEIDILTGDHKIIRADILHDAGNSINESIDLGQIAGGFVQGLGWCTIEECKWDSKGNLLNHSPDTYKIPTINNIPEDFRIELLKGFPNENTIKKSKAVGEPPFMLALSVWLAIKDAISSVGNHNHEPKLNIPATNEKIISAIEKL